MNLVASIDINLPKAVIADFFAVSRSAVTQTCRNRSVKDDLVSRIYRYLDRQIADPSAKVHMIQKYSVYLLQDVRLVVDKRNVDRVKRAGRPCVKFNFTEIKRLIRAIVAELTASHSVINTQTTREIETHTPVTQNNGRALRSRVPEMDDTAYQKMVERENLRNASFCPNGRPVRRFRGME